MATKLCIQELQEFNSDKSFEWQITVSVIALVLQRFNAICFITGSNFDRIYKVSLIRRRAIFLPSKTGMVGKRWPSDNTVRRFGLLSQHASMPQDKGSWCFGCHNTLQECCSTTIDMLLTT